MLDREMEVPIILPKEEDGDACAYLLLDALDQQKGVHSAQVDFEKGLLHLHYDPELIDYEQVDGIASDLGVRLGARMRHCTLQLGGVACRNCAFNLERELNAVPGVHRVTANPAARVIGVQYETDAILQAVEKRIEELGFHIAGPSTEPKASFWRRNTGLIWAGLTLLFLLLGVAAENWGPLLVPVFPQLYIVFFVLAYIAGGHDALREAVRDLRHGALNVDFLMIASALGAASIGLWAEGATLLFRFSLSGALESLIHLRY